MFTSPSKTNVATTKNQVFLTIQASEVKTDFINGEPELIMLKWDPIKLNSQEVVHPELSLHFMWSIELWHHVTIWLCSIYHRLLHVKFMNFILLTSDKSFPLCAPLPPLSPVEQLLLSSVGAAVDFSASKRAKSSEASHPQNETW